MGQSSNTKPLGPGDRTESRWLAEHTQRIRVETLRETAAAWPTMTRDMVSRGYVQDWLLDRAAVEAGEPRVLPAGRPVDGPTTPLRAWAVNVNPEDSGLRA